MTAYNIKTVRFSTGERFPMLVESQTGNPDYWITVYSMTQLRAKGLAVNTISQVLRHLILFMFFSKNHYSEEIDLDKRLAEGKLLELHEIESLCDICKLPYKDYTLETTSNISNRTIKLNSLEQFRRASTPKRIASVDTQTVAHRIRAIRDFLTWRSKTFLSKHPNFGLKTLSLNDTIKLTISAFDSRIPKHRTSSPIHSRKGLSKDELGLLLSIINRTSVLNPWKGDFARIRNELMILWLCEFGLRRGELLSLKISDIDFRSETFLVLRRPDDPDDPRLNQPLVKTRERKLLMSKEILNLTSEYIFKYRSTLPNAKYHEFLFVADKSGKPMSAIAINKIFSKLKEINPSLPKDLSPHVLRHSWNDWFSTKMDEQKVPEESEKKMRSYLMGWSDTSNSASTYTKRFVQEKANQVILEMGNKLTNGKVDKGTK